MLQLNVQTDFLSLLKEHIKLSSYIPCEFHQAFYKNTGRPRGVSIESFLWFCILESFLGINLTKTSNAVTPKSFLRKLIIPALIKKSLILLLSNPFCSTFWR